MRVLVISDKYLSKAQLSSFVDSDLTYFSLTSDKEINDHNKQILIKSSSFTELQSADYINHEIDNLNLKLDEIRVKTSNILYKKHIFITPGTIFGSQGEGYIRFSLCVTEDQIQTAINRIKA